MTETTEQRNVSAPVVISVIWAAVFVLGAWPAVATVFLFDQGTDLELWAWFIFYGIWAFEFMALLMVPGIWLAWALTRRKSWGGKFLTILAFVPLIALIPVVAAFFMDNA